MSEVDTTTLDALVARLERAAEQLRTGDLSADAAAGLVEDAAGVASQASAELERMARAAQQEQRAAHRSAVGRRRAERPCVYL
jgi:hypothetical protein